MHRHQITFGVLIAITLMLGGCAASPAHGGWTTLIDGDKGLENWNQVGNANWRAEGGAIVADAGTNGFLVSKESYTDFAIRAEFWAATNTNSGIFLRLSDPTNITFGNSYEVNIWDSRPDPTYGTGAIVNFAAVPVPQVFLAGGSWNTFEIEIRGSVATVAMNGVTTTTMNDDTFSSGPFALQFGPGVQGAMGGPIKWRKVQVKVL